MTTRLLDYLTNRLPTKPTARGWALFGIAWVLYFFANQTQTGWLYIFSAIAFALWFIALFTPRAMLKHLAARRRVNGRTNLAELELKVGDPLTVELELHNPSRTLALHLQGIETCPTAPAADRAQSFFVPVLSGRSAQTLPYTTTCARRGWFEFPSLPMLTRAPFGFFEARRELPASTDGLLVFPEYRELKALPLFDRRPAVEAIVPRVGIGGEFVGVREYRPGDSPRHVHWRSTARLGRLIVKEFTEETQPGLTIALDARLSSLAGDDDDDNSFELAVKVAATLAHYGHSRQLPVSLAVNSKHWPAPSGPLTWWALMNYLARVQAGGEEPFASTLGTLRGVAFVAAILTAPDGDALNALAELKQRRVGVMAIVLDPARFRLMHTDAFSQAAAIASALRVQGVDVRVIDGEEDWEHVLEK